MRIAIDTNRYRDFCEDDAKARGLLQSADRIPHVVETVEEGDQVVVASGEVLGAGDIEAHTVAFGADDYFEVMRFFMFGISIRSLTNEMPSL